MTLDVNTIIAPPISILAQIFLAELAKLGWNVPVFGSPAMAWGGR